MIVIPVHKKSDKKIQTTYYPVQLTEHHKLSDIIQTSSRGHLLRKTTIQPHSVLSFENRIIKTSHQKFLGLIS